MAVNVGPDGLDELGRYRRPNDEERIRLTIEFEKVIKEGGEIAAMKMALNHKNQFGALACACKMFCHDIAKKLIIAGWDVNDRDDWGYNDTTLQLLVIYGHEGSK